MSDWFQQTASGWDDGGGGYAGGGGPQDPYNGAPQYAGNDPFAYTQGSLLTPWEGRFDGSQYGSGGSGVASFQPFNYKPFNYTAARPEGFQERYNDPGNFVYGDYQSPDAFKAPTAEDMQADPGYAFRMQQGQKALQASKAAQGVLRTGGAAKAMQQYGQEYGSQEYGNVYNRRAGEYDRNQQEGRFSYGTNRANAAENWDRNVSNQRTAHQIRQYDWRGNADVALEGSRHGYDVAQGVYDRGYAHAQGNYAGEQANRQARASAGAAGANRDYSRGLAEYQMARDEFWTNQDRQYSILDREAQRGYGAASDYAGAASNLYTDRANAEASGVVGSANARAGAVSNIGGTLGGLALYGAQQGGYAQPRTSPMPGTPYAGGYLPTGYWG